MARLAALIVLLIPGILAAFGIKLMRDTFFGLQILPIGGLVSIYKRINIYCFRIRLLCRLFIEP